MKVKIESPLSVWGGASLRCCLSILHHSSSDQINKLFTSNWVGICCRWPHEEPMNVWANSALAEVRIFIFALPDGACWVFFYL